MDAVLVIWVDAVSEDAWTDLKKAKKYKPHEIHTVGYLVKENDNEVVVASSWDVERKAVCSFITIPTGWIKLLVAIPVPKFSENGELIEQSTAGE